MTTKKKIFTVALLCIALILAVAQPASAASAPQRRELEYTRPIRDTEVSHYHSVTLSINGVALDERAYLIHDVTYIPLRAAATLANAEVTYRSLTRTATVRMPGLTLSATDGAYTVTANDRPLLSRTPVKILSDGRMYIPVRTFAKVFSLDVTWHEGRHVSLVGTIKPLPHANEFYREDELYWLSRIISAESQGEPLLGQVAVGTVVLSRVKSPDYPNTIWGVIFDTRHGVQFSPVANGTIYNTPYYDSVIAAKICLEGTVISEPVLFFLQPEKSTSDWIIKNRRYAFSVGNHYFFY